MSLTRAIKRAVLARQGGHCAGEVDGERCRVHLETLRRARHVQLPPGRSAVEFDHIIPRSQATGGTVWLEGEEVPVDDPRNVQALCAWCHAEKCEGERAGYRRAAPSAFTERGIKPRADWRPAEKAMRLRVGAPAKSYGVL